LEKWKVERAFSLAEVLITITIIGVVVVMLIPFFENINQRAWDGAKQSTAERTKEGLKQLEQRDGINTFSSTAAFVDELGKDYFKIAKVCTNAELSTCIPLMINSSGTAITQPLDANGIWGGDSSWKSVGVVFASGVTMNMAYQPYCAKDGSVCMGAIMDVNGFARPNQMGHDVARFLVAYNPDGSFGVSYAPPEVTPADVAYSASGQYDSGGGVMKDDYWSGAKNACAAYPSAGEWHLPTKEELNLLYLDNVKYGDNKPKFSPVNYWSSTEYSSTYA